MNNHKSMDFGGQDADPLSVGIGLSEYSYQSYCISRIIRNGKDPLPACQFKNKPESNWPVYIWLRSTTLVSIPSLILLDREGYSWTRGNTPVHGEMLLNTEGYSWTWRDTPGYGGTLLYMEGYSWTWRDTPGHGGILLDLERCSLTRRTP